MSTQQPSELAGNAPIPEDNLPGHHPVVEQDKPTGPPKLPPRHHRFSFRRDPLLALASLPFGVTPQTAFVDVDDHRLQVRFGPWVITTPMENVEGAERTGPYQWWKVVGPPRLSLRDLGITFATTAAEGVCIRFREPVHLFPHELVAHRALTVTVEEPEDLVRFIDRT